MPRIKELIELAKQSYALANDTLHLETKKGLQDLAAKYEQQANELRRIEVTRAGLTDFLYQYDREIIALARHYLAVSGTG